MKKYKSSEYPRFEGLESRILLSDTCYIDLDTMVFADVDKALKDTAYVNYEWSGSIGLNYEQAFLLRPGTNHISSKGASIALNPSAEQGGTAFFIPKGENISFSGNFTILGKDGRYGAYGFSIGNSTHDSYENINISGVSFKNVDYGVYMVNTRDRKLLGNAISISGCTAENGKKMVSINVGGSGGYTPNSPYASVTGSTMKGMTADKGAVDLPHITETHEILGNSGITNNILISTNAIIDPSTYYYCSSPSGNRYALDVARPFMEAAPDDPLGQYYVEGNPNPVRTIPIGVPDINDNMVITLFGDANLDGLVDMTDYQIWWDNYGATNATWNWADFNSDSLVDMADYCLWFNNYGESVSGGSGGGSQTPARAQTSTQILTQTPASLTSIESKPIKAYSLPAEQVLPAQTTPYAMVDALATGKINTPAYSQPQQYIHKKLPIHLRSEPSSDGELVDLISSSLASPLKPVLK